MDSDIYRTIEKESEGIFRDKGSKFLAFAYPVSTDEQIKEIITNLKKKYHDARHYCYAYRIGKIKFHDRLNDDGEPSGTGGRPIFGQILSHELSDTLIVVVRYFGGILLGTSGLIIAYRSAASNCLSNAKIIERTIDRRIKIKFLYKQMDLVMRIIKEESIEVASQDFSLNCIMELNIRLKIYNGVCERLLKIENLILEET